MQSIEHFVLVFLFPWLNIIVFFIFRVYTLKIHTHTHTHMHTLHIYIYIYELGWPKSLLFGFSIKSYGKNLNELFGQSNNISVCVCVCVCVCMYFMLPGT